MADAETFVEVKRGRAGALDFAWFDSVFPKNQLTVVCATPFETNSVRGVTIHDFLMGPKGDPLVI